jgi:hypothetical protein
MGRPTIEPGMRFERLVVEERAGTSKCGSILWHCKCDCGNETTVSSADLKRGSTRSCGCLLRESGRANGIKSRTSHGDSRHGLYHRLYKIWQGVKARCTIQSATGFLNYGGRGIAVCEEWANDYSAFKKWALENGYKPDAKFGECTIDRIDNDGNYCPENCRWVDMSAQRNNQKHREAEVMGNEI